MVYITSYRTAEIQHTRYRGNLIQNNNSPEILFIQVHKHQKVNIAIQLITETKENAGHILKIVTKLIPNKF